MTRTLTKTETIYEQCIRLARKSPCQKRGFGCVLRTSDGVFAARAYNHSLECTKHICEPECIRLKINSGMDSLIGACGHAEEHAIWETMRTHGMRAVREATLYVAGVIKPSNELYIKTDPYFYCIRCATLMMYAGVFGVNVNVGGPSGEWHFLTTEMAYQTSLDFALGKRLA